MVFSNVLDLSSNASANSKLHGMRDLVSPADALSLGAETLFVFLLVSVFTDHTLAHPLNCRGGVVARLSA